MAAREDILATNIQSPSNWTLQKNTDFISHSFE